MSRLLRVAAGLAGLAAGVTLVRRLTAPHVPDRPTIEKPPSPSSTPPSLSSVPPSPSGVAPAPAPARPSSAPTAPAPAEPTTAEPTRMAGEPTRQQLYEEARRLDIQGRSKMSKEELSQAVSERRRETP